MKMGGITFLMEAENKISDRQCNPSKKVWATEQPGQRCYENGLTELGKPEADMHGSPLA